MKKNIGLIVTVLLFFSFVTKPLIAAKPVEVKTPLLAADVELSPSPVPANPSPSTDPKPSTTPAPTTKPQPSPTSAPIVPTAVPTVAPTQVPLPLPVVTKQNDENQKEKTKTSVGEIMSQIVDTPTPTPTPKPVEVLQNIVPDTSPIPEKPDITAPLKTIGQALGPSATFFLHTIPGNYYLINSLSQPESFGLLAIAFLLMGSGFLLLYKTQKEEIFRTLDTFMSAHILSFWSRNKHIFYTIFDRDYAK